MINVVLGHNFCIGEGNVWLSTLCTAQRQSAKVTGELDPAQLLLGKVCTFPFPDGDLFSNSFKGIQNAICIVQYIV